MKQHHDFTSPRPDIPADTRAAQKGIMSTSQRVLRIQTLGGRTAAESIAQLTSYWEASISNGKPLRSLLGDLDECIRQLETYRTTVLTELDGLDKDVATDGTREGAKWKPHRYGATFLTMVPVNTPAELLY